MTSQPERHWSYGTADYTEAGDEELAELWALIDRGEDGLFHMPSEGRDG